MDKWDVIRIYCDFLPQPHDKFCICICPIDRLFYYINSEPPIFRRARNVAVTLQNYEAQFLTHTSYVDTTSLVQIHEQLDHALADEERLHGPITPSLRSRIKDAARQHNALTEAKLRKVLEDT